MQTRHQAGWFPSSRTWHHAMGLPQRNSNRADIREYWKLKTQGLQLQVQRCPSLVVSAWAFLWLDKHLHSYVLTLTPIPHIFSYTHTLLHSHKHTRAFSHSYIYTYNYTLIILKCTHTYALTHSHAATCSHTHLPTRANSNSLCRRPLTPALCCLAQPQDVSPRALQPKHSGPPSGPLSLAHSQDPLSMQNPSQIKYGNPVSVLSNTFTILTTFHAGESAFHLVSPTTKMLSSSGPSEGKIGFPFYLRCQLLCLHSEWRTLCNVIFDKEEVLPSIHLEYAPS